MIGTPFSQALTNNFIQRRSMLENEAMISALYLDPCFCFKLTEAEKGNAITHILKTYNRILGNNHFN